MSQFELAEPPVVEPTPLTVFLADDHPVVMAGIKAIVMEDPGFEVIGQAADGIEALRKIIDIRPDILILDISLPGLNGLEIARRLRTECPLCRILALTVHEDGGYVRQLLAYGVSGYLLKQSAPEDLIRALTAIAKGGLYLDPGIAGKAVETGTKTESDIAADDCLSLREEEVIRLTASGYSNKSVAFELKVGVKSVETYKARAMDKLGIRNRVQLVRYAVRKGWLEG